MKTVEEKAKAYDEAIERAKKVFNRETNDREPGTSICEYIFPELRESENEKIRKELIRAFKSLNTIKVWNGIERTDILAWLEKQGSEPNWCHHKVDLSGCSEEYRKAYYDGWNNCNQQHSQCKSERNDVVKCLINGMKFYYEDNEEATWGTEKFSMRVKDILSWLERQGEQKVSVVEFNAKDWYVSKVDGKIYNAKFMKKNSTNLARKLEIEKAAMSATGIIGREEWFIKGAEWADENPAYISSEKQGEQKPTLRERYKNIAESEWFKKTHDGMSVSDDEKVDNVNKVEPKFKVGNFIKHNRLNVIHEIISFNGDHYFVRNAKTGNIIKLCNAERNFHLWTIQDAKDGDVLIDKSNVRECPFVFKATKPSNIKTDIPNPLVVLGYCGIGGAGFTKGSGWGDTANCIYYPATKEQRDLLFQKMKEAGYEWLEETKELKKIEQKTTQVIKPFEAEHGKYYYCIKDYFCGGRKQASKGDVVQALRGLPIMGLKDASEYFLPVNFIKCNSAWSKEDEEMCQETIDWFEKKCFPYALENDNPARESIKWLKSLKNRALPQSKQEWSKEDERNLNDAILFIETGTYSLDKDNLINWLKSLRPQWKPSDEQLNNLKQAINAFPYETDYLELLYDDLKKLKGE